MKEVLYTVRSKEEFSVICFFDLFKAINYIATIWITMEEIMEIS